jgi:hypothetical protein
MMRNSCFGLVSSLPEELVSAVQRVVDEAVAAGILFPEFLERVRQIPGCAPQVRPAPAHMQDRSDP